VTLFVTSGLYQGTLTLILKGERSLSGLPPVLTRLTGWEPAAFQLAALFLYFQNNLVQTSKASSSGVRDTSPIYLEGEHSLPVLFKIRAMESLIVPRAPLKSIIIK